MENNSIPRIINGSLITNKDPLEKESDFGISSNIRFNPSILFSAIEDKRLNEIPDQELYDLIRESYKDLLKRVFELKDVRYLDAFTDNRMLSMLIQVINQSTLTIEERVYCNKLAYDYLSLDKDKTNEYTKSLLLSLSKIVNRDMIPGLLGLGLDPEISMFLCLARYSSFDERVNIKRLNLVITSRGPEVMTEQMIVYIFEKMYNHFTLPFETTMFSEEDDDDSDAVIEVNGNIDLAMLDIINNMPSESIAFILKSYAKDYEYESRTKARFDITNISADYSRILNVIEILKQSGIKFPV